MPKKRQYNRDSLLEALRAVSNETMSVRKAAKEFGVPRSSIQYLIKNPQSKMKSGPNPILTTAEEDMLVEWIIDMAERGFPRKKEDVKLCVQKFLVDNPRENPFIDNKPGNGWMKAFLKRNPILVERTSEGVTNASALVSEADIRKWFHEINCYIEKENLQDVIRDPKRVFNADETGFNICPKTGKVLAQKGLKNVYEIERASSKENISVMFTFAADGFCLKPMIIYAYQRMPERIIDSIPPGWGVSKSEKGWMTAAVFYEFISNVFYKQICEAGIPLPVILFVDGHKSHVTIEVTELCRELNIHLIALYPNATRILQPADVAAFRPIKATWRKTLRKWYSDQNYTTALNKMNFAPILEKALDGAISQSTLINGFRATGLFPFNPDEIDFTKCLPQPNTDTVPAPNQTQKDSTYNLDRKKELKTMTCYQFRSFLSDDLWSRFNQLDSLDGLSAEMIALFKIWVFFNPINNELLLSQNDKRTRQALQTLPIVDEHDGFRDEDFRDIDTYFLNEKTGVMETIGEADAKSTPEITDDLCKHGPKPQIEENKKIEVLSNVPLNVYLKTRMWPCSPKRKGKRNIEKMPFAMTSDEYRDIMKEKKEKKDKLEKEKEERKQKRLENKRKKSNYGEISKKKLKSVRDKCSNKENELSMPLTSTGITHRCSNIKPCIVCKRDTIINIVSCSNCTRNFHKKCIPSAHQTHIPEEEDDLFLCHTAHTYEVEDESDESDEDLFNSIVHTKY